MATGEAFQGKQASAGRHSGNSTRQQRPRKASAVTPWLLGPIAVASGTAVAHLIRDWIAEVDTAMILLGAVMLVAFRGSVGASVFTALLSVAAFDFFFVKPYHTFAVAELDYVITFIVMTVTGVLLSALASAMRAERDTADVRAWHMEYLYRLAERLAVVDDPDELIANAASYVGETLDVRVAIEAADGRTVCPRNSADRPSAPASQRRRLVGAEGELGTLVVYEANDLSTEQRELLEGYVLLIAAAWERASIASDAEDARLEAESERMRSSLLSSVSHDLRTPMGSIMGASTTLLSHADRLSPGARRDLLETIRDESARLDRLLGNLLEMTRIEGGHLRVSSAPELPSEVIGTVISRFRRQTGSVVEIDVFEEGLVPMDATLIDIVITNLLENADRYSEQPIRVRVRSDADACTIEVLDRGPGFTREETRLAQEKFWRRENDPSAGAGLGLAICKAIVSAHDGEFFVQPRDGGGANVGFSIPASHGIPLSNPDIPRRIDEQ